MKTKPTQLSRRDFVALLAAAPALGFGCGAADKNPRFPTGGGFSFTIAERRLIEAPGEALEIVVRGGPLAQVLRATTRAVPPGVDLTGLAKKMEATMLATSGVGLAGPQVGLGLRVATLKIDYNTDSPRIVFAKNPVIVERSDETVEGYEGCLSIPGVGGLVRRNTWVRVRHETPEGELVYTRAADANAVLWQHELDHLDGELYVDKLLGELLPLEEVRRLRREMGSDPAVKEPPLDQKASTQLPLEGVILTC